MMQLQTSSLVAQTAAFFNAVGRSKSIAANGHLPLFSATTLMGLPFNNFLCRIFRRLSQTHQTRAEINSGPLTLNAPNRGGGFVSVYRLATRNLALFVKNLMLQGFQPSLRGALCAVLSEAEASSLLHDRQCLLMGPEIASQNLS